MPDTTRTAPITEDSLPHLREEHRMLRAQVRRFVQEQVKPWAGEWEETGMVPRDILRQMGTLGFLGIRSPKSTAAARWMRLRPPCWLRNLATRPSAAFPSPCSSTLIWPRPIWRTQAAPNRCADGCRESFPANASQRSRLRSPTPDRTWRRCRTVARREGDSYVLNGTKTFITDGVHADLYFVAAKTNTSARGAHGISIFAIEKGTPGFSVSRALKKQGWLCSDTAELVFDNCRVPINQRIGRGEPRLLLNNAQFSE